MPVTVGNGSRWPEQMYTMMDVAIKCEICEETKRRSKNDGHLTILTPSVSMVCRTSFLLSHPLTWMIKKTQREAAKKHHFTDNAIMLDNLANNTTIHHHALLLTGRICFSPSNRDVSPYITVTTTDSADTPTFPPQTLAQL